MNEITEDRLTCLLAFIRGKNNYSPFEVGIHTYPDKNEQQRQNHAECEELERRGLIYRYADEMTYTLWLPTNPPAEQEGR